MVGFKIKCKGCGVFFVPNNLLRKICDDCQKTKTRRIDK